MKELLKHAPLEQFKVVDNSLYVGGLSPEKLAERASRTPFYAYDQQAISSRIQHLKACLPSEVKLHYAIKANPLLPLVQHVAKLVDGLDVASLGEVDIALETSIPPHNISYAGPGKTDNELAAAIEAGIIINIESEREMHRIVVIGDQTGFRPIVSVRINPDFELKSSGMKMGGGPKPFGVDAELVPDLLSRIGQVDLDFRGFHIYSGSQNLRAEAIVESQIRSFELAVHLAEHAPSPITWLNIGGGFGIPYFPGENRLDIQPIADNLSQIVSRANSTLPQAELILELGRYLVGEAGIYVCKVIDRKVSRGRIYLVVDGGLHHHLAASGNLGQVIRKNYPVIAIEKVHSCGTEIVNIVGPLCTPLDVIADQIPMPCLYPGDLIGILQSGAYGYTASPIRFLNHPLPAEIIV
jgi:diaminopimelate decarboxylase